MIVHKYIDDQFYTRRLIQIVPRAPMYLREQHNPGEGQVCRAISNVWEAIPLLHCESIRGWIRGQPYFRRLTIEVLPATGFEDRDACAWFDQRYRLIAFKSYMAAEMSMDCLRAVVAHEFAHVVQASWANPMVPSNKLETEADDLAKEWGFDNFVVKKWIRRRDDRRVTREGRRREAKYRRLEEDNPA